MGNELFKKTVEGVLLKYVGESGAYVSVSSVHSGSCGAHQAGHKMRWLLMCSGVYCPSMLKDCIEFARGYQECQLHGGIQHMPTSELHAIVKPWAFRGWALDVIGEIRPASSKQQKFRVPETITTNQGTVFTVQKIQEFAKEVGIKLLTSTPYYAQANGQVEAAKKVIISHIKKHVGKKTKNWHKTFDQALWACRTSPKEATGTTPSRLTYGHDAVLPVKIQVHAVIIQRQREIPSEDHWIMMADELVNLDEERMVALHLLQRQKERVSRTYNKKVKDKIFVVDDLVWKVILPMDRNDRVFGKWSPNWEGPFKIIWVFSNNPYKVEELAPDK
ncbi:uncharacterized protein LOC131648845 [Vicia villosa]|uniref:uncharacterized protein LOC131648845 n=1 Tax=Vicia villosa TaxID=3911 RepID=UPI00273C81B8|nr:uncharacterized protein LOC131648845 [Vicia villosa]